MKIEGKSTRFHERTALAVPLEVIYSETPQIVWRERTQIEEITICGGGFTLSRPLEPRRLVHLKMPLPKRFRLFDFGQTVYDVWGLVRYVRLLGAGVDGRIRLKIGAALIGGSPPKSFLADPATLYDLKPILPNNSLWQLRELPRRTGPYARSAEERRAVRMKVILETLADDGRIVETRAAETQNVSESGMALTVQAFAAPPRYVLVRTENSFSLLAKVRRVHALTEETARLHLEFISGKWFV